MSSRSDVLKVGNVSYTYYPVNRVAGYEKLPFSLTVLLENILRNAESDDRASELAQRLVEAGLSGEVGSEIGNFLLCSTLQSFAKRVTLERDEHRCVAHDSSIRTGKSTLPYITTGRTI